MKTLAWLLFIFFFGLTWLFFLAADPISTVVVTMIGICVLLGIFISKN